MQLTLEMQEIRNVLDHSQVPFPFQEVHKSYRLNKSKLLATELRIKRELRTTLRGKTLILGYSGGKDSSVLLHLFTNLLGKNGFKVIYNDTTIEYAHVKNWVLNFLKQEGYDYHVARPEHTFFWYLNHKGWRIPTSNKYRYCCHILKRNPLMEFYSQFEDACSVSGVRAEESSKRCRYDVIHVFPAGGGYPENLALHPLLNWTTEDIWGYIDHFDVPCCKEAYKLREVIFRGRQRDIRVGCWCCFIPNLDWMDLETWIHGEKYYLARKRVQEKYNVLSNKDYNLKKNREEHTLGWF